MVSLVRMPSYGKRETPFKKVSKYLRRHNLQHGMDSPPPYPQVTNPLKYGCIKGPAKLYENVGEPTAIDPIEFE